jgi:hypothetical protein
MRDLTNTHEEATEKENTAGQEDPILTIQPEDGTGLVIKGMVEKGSGKGFPLFGSFYNQNGDPIDARSELSMKYETPGADDRKTVTFPLTNLSSYNSLSIPEQQDAEKIDQVKHVIKGTDRALANNSMPKIGIGHLDKLHLVLDSEDVIDWDHPKTKVYFARQAVEEVN